MIEKLIEEFEFIAFYNYDSMVREAAEIAAKALQQEYIPDDILQIIVKYESEKI